MPFTAPKDIANLALQSLGLPRIAALSENSKQANEMSALYDKIRQEELRSHVWSFATRRAALRPAIAGTSKQITFAAWASGTTYQKGDLVRDTTTDAGNDATTALYVSLVAANLGNIPSSATKYSGTWAPYFGSVLAESYDATHTYSLSEMVFITTSTYLNLANGTIAMAPASGAPWTAATLTGVTQNTLFIEYPMTQVNSGVSRTAYQLPYGFLRIAPQDVKTAGVAYQTTGAGMQFSDWQFEGNYLLTAQATNSNIAALGPLLLRFVADIMDVSRFDALFSRSFAARLAFEGCETLTGNPKLKQDMAAMYDRFIAEAKLTSMIEQGSSDPADAEYPLSRIPSAGGQKGGGVNTGHTVNIGGQ